MLINRKLVRTVEISFLFLIVGIFVVVFAFFNKLEDGIMDFVSRFGFLSIFLTSFLTDLFMQPIGPDIPLIAGLITGLNTTMVFVMAWGGSVLASFIGYWLGRSWGEYGFNEIYGRERYSKWRRRYRKYGRLALLFAALTPVPYVPFCWIAGIFNMRKTSFLFYGVLARGVRLLGVTYLTLFILSL